MNCATHSDFPICPFAIKKKVIPGHVPIASFPLYVVVAILSSFYNIFFVSYFHRLGAKRIQ